MLALPLDLPAPESGFDFDRVFSTREACLAAVIKVRWPGGFACPRCKHSHAWLHRRRPVLECSACGKKTSPLAGTLFANTKLELSRLFKLCYLIVAAKSGVSALELARQAGVCENTAIL
jgi:Zn ribbon nucleic-acid-binding protein